MGDKNFSETSVEQRTKYNSLEHKLCMVPVSERVIVKSMASILKIRIYDTSFLKYRKPSPVRLS
jgi:hypothetical protein